MIKNRLFLLLLLWPTLALNLVACSTESANDSSARPTPTLLVARFRTPTPTLIVSPTVLVPPTPTPREPSPTPTLASPLPTPTIPPSPTSGVASAAEVLPTAVTTSTATSEPTATATVVASPPTATPSPTPIPPPAAPGGRIAFPIDDGGGHYDIWILEIPDGLPFVVLNRARQPNFSSQGQLLVNNEESSQGENIGLLDSNFTWLGLVSDAPEDRHPFWSQDSSTYVFSNPNMLLDPLTQERLPFLFIPCSLRRPVEEQEQKCRDTAGQSKLTSGSYPVWTDDNRVAFYGTAGEDGLYLISAWATARGSGGSTDPQLIMPVSDGRPSDTHGNRLYFSASTLHGNWEAYAVNLDGSNLVNLSNGPDSQDGLPAVSPDGQWVAFVSNRAGPWGIWLVPSSGGTPELLLDLSTINTNPSPWGAGDHDWTNERITWGP